MTKTKRLFFLFFLPCVLLLVIFYTPSGLEDRIYKCYFTIWINLICIYIVWLLIITKRKIDLFDPFVLATLIHILLFEISPLYYIFKGEMLWFNIDVWDGCIKGTWLSTIGYVSMAIGYFINFKIGSHVSGAVSYTHLYLQDRIRSYRPWLQEVRSHQYGQGGQSHQHHGSFQTSLRDGDPGL